MGRSTPYQIFKRHLKGYNEWVKENPIETSLKSFEELPIIPLHGLRHLCATLLNSLDVIIIDISDILGHAKISTTMNTYAHSFEKKKPQINLRNTFQNKHKLNLQKRAYGFFLLLSFTLFFLNFHIIKSIL